MRHIISTITLVFATALAGCASAPHGAAHANTSDRAETASASRIVEGDLDISNESSLAAYENLEIVTGALTIQGNTRLQNLDGLEHLRAVGRLVIKENLALTSLEALSALRHAKSVTIDGNPELENLHGLESLKQLDRLVVTDNGIFCTSGVGGLVEVGELVVSKNPRLLSLRGFSHLESAVSVSIVENPRIAPQSGFLGDLRRVSGKVEVKRNAGINAADIRALKRRLQREVELASR